MDAIEQRVFITQLNATLAQITSRAFGDTRTDIPAPASVDATSSAAAVGNSPGSGPSTVSPDPSARMCPGPRSSVPSVVVPASSRLAGTWASSASMLPRPFCSVRTSVDGPIAPVAVAAAATAAVAVALANTMTRSAGPAGGGGLGGGGGGGAEGGG